MRFATRLLLTLPVVCAGPTVLAAQPQAAPVVARTEASPPLSVRWNRLVPKFVDESAARPRPARSAAKAAGDSAALRRIAQTPPPFLLRIDALLSVAQYAAANSARENSAVSSDAAIAAASAAVLTQIFADSAVRASIARELARDIEQAGTGPRGTELATAGRVLGEDVAARVIASAPPPLMLAAPWKGTIPTGPGKWYSAPGIPPIGIFI